MSSTEASESNNRRLPPIDVATVMDSTVQKVWDVIVDFKNYGAWNRWVVKLEGEAVKGGRVRAYDKSGTALDLEITSIQEPYRICWNDVTWFTRLGLGGWRCRSIEALPDNRGIKFTNHFEFTGVLGGALDFFTREFLEKGMKLENDSLREFVESR